MKIWRPPRDVREIAAPAASALLARRLKIDTAAKPEPIPADPWTFIAQCVWTYDERAAIKGGDPVRKFPASAYLKHLVTIWKAVKLLHVKKSRQLLVTWLFAALYLHKALTRRGTRVAWFCLKWDKANEHIRNRVYRIYQQIPLRFAKPLAVMTDEGLVVYHDGPKTLATAWILPMAAETAKAADAATQMRSLTYTDAYFDEAEFYTNQSELIHSTMPNTEAMALVSSANGDTYVNRLGYSERIEDPNAPMVAPQKERVARGIEMWDRYSFRHVEVHYCADPAKDPETPKGKLWYEEAYNRFPDKMKWRREMELDSSVAAGEAVFSDSSLIHFTPQSYDPTLQLYCGRDFQYTAPVAVFFQVRWTPGVGKSRPTMSVHVLLEVRMVSMTIEAFERNYVAPQRKKYFGDAEVIEFGDPAGKGMRDVSSMSSIQVLQAMGRQIRFRYTKIDARLAKLQSIITAAALYVDPRTCVGLCRDLRGGYYRDNHGKPVKDGVHDHGPDAFGYAIDCVFEFENPEVGGALVFRPEGLEDVQTGLSADGSVWVPTAEDERRDGKR